MSRRTNVCLAIVATFGFTASADADQVCSTINTAGKYIAACSGFNRPPGGGNLPVAFLGFENRAEDGQWSNSGTYSFGGASVIFLELKSVGPAQVNPDCTGSVSYSVTANGQPSPSAHFNFVVGEDSREIHAIQTDPQTVLMCTHTRVSH